MQNVIIEANYRPFQILGSELLFLSRYAGFARPAELRLSKFHRLTQYVTKIGTSQVCGLRQDNHCNSSNMPPAPKITGPASFDTFTRPGGKPARPVTDIRLSYFIRLERSV